ncbi:proline synthase co transcribed bacterial [Trichuris trichiura]|uniref:Pyridoxal phosphate homeostasis protein n=1 Tax=Trichuris trichiura TaxID=36087 RepID=A0A077ZH81_TRITR|nr:proline synthase co transcribed bacterial [Trichuris trichiura]
MNCIEANLKKIQKRINDAFETTDLSRRSRFPRLVAVSKFKPVSDICLAYQAGQRHFGENYVQELLKKSNDEQLLIDCADIRWHLIGHLQSNKVNKVVSSIPQLYMIETVDSVQLAESLNAAVGRRPEGTRKLNVMVQVNTSDEEQKSGIRPSEACMLTAHIRSTCNNLNFVGFMTIGRLDHSDAGERDENPDFRCLLDVREALCKENGIPIDQVELSMGMSGDFEQAIRMGSTNVRIGSSIFGTRDAAQSD